ncbi:MAG: diacylglycerol kinase [Pseudopedobacter saltans]|uniref:Diacylglycerol kinase n=1 Tax=Pseudopedobacter saltans TaxID=151895 RepID=A0A2W5GYK4_9SPHI|nr:MAG: diacylglycerol kinase [Pseudopedobacter saltans]
MIDKVLLAGEKDAILEQIKVVSKEKNLPFEFVETNASGNYDFLIDKINSEKVTDVIIIGGDGTVNQAVSALYKDVKARFGIIPFGSGNGLANTAGISNKPEKALEQILESKHTMDVDAFMINDRFACMLSGLGLDAKVAHEFAHKEKRGLITYTQQSIVEFFKAQPYQFEINVDGFSFFTDAFFISVANSNQFGNNFTIAPLAQLNDGLLDIVIVQKMNKASLPFAVLKQIRGNNKLQQLVEDMSQKNILYFQTPNIKIKNRMRAPLHIDGEPVETIEELDIQIIPNCFKLLC